MATTTHDPYDGTLLEFGDQGPNPNKNQDDTKQQAEQSDDSATVESEK
jgi:hypothetical protein